jgi:hypothetical protein
VRQREASVSGWYADSPPAEKDRLTTLAAGVLSRVMELETGDQIEVLALVVAGWCYARDRHRGEPHAHPFSAPRKPSAREEVPAGVHVSQEQQEAAHGREISSSERRERQ